jgi:phosphate-selective porin
MKTITYTLALALGLAFSAMAFAADVTTAKTKAECSKAGGMWDATAKTCKAKSGGGY